MTDHQNTHQLPDWEAPAPKKSIFSKFTTQSPPAYAKKEAPGENATTAKRTFTDRFLPRWAKRSRKTLIITIVALVLLLALILGLGLGLGLSHNPGPGFGACGYENKATDAICAVAHALWDSQLTSSNPNDNPLCGKMIRITRYNEAVGGNRSVDVMVVDKCMGCEPTDLDLSIKMFTTLADESLGRVVGSWAWLN
ncbi:hypothetical protein IFR04_008764 [Cadophora malorum]|uniref:RlpA-like protein double-psi beta-barrel domain-containing protein n=1 Tax=Cadophora malorum TaxID=108018 RepID=A0A8H7TFY9_9HELO|nr:hypothetical protein IFR04_008764 [Cadophora malorum]